MENRKYKTLVIALTSALTLTGCGITITRNQYYSSSDQTEYIKLKKKDSICTADTLTIRRDGQK